MKVRRNASQPTAKRSCAICSDQRHEGIKAAGLTGFQAMAVEGDALASLAKRVPVGKGFSSGKGFVPFVKREVGAQLARIVKNSPDLLIDDPDDGRWIAMMEHVHESRTKDHPLRMLTLRWKAFPEEDTITRRFDQVGLMHFASRGAETATADDTNPAVTTRVLTIMCAEEYQGDQSSLPN